MTASESTTKPAPERRAYVKPTLQSKGSIAELTKAVSGNSAHDYDGGGFPNFYS
jgi:hypothetical protein